MPFTPPALRPIGALRFREEDGLASWLARKIICLPSVSLAPIVRIRFKIDAMMPVERGLENSVRGGFFHRAVFRGQEDEAAFFLEIGAARGR